MVRVRSIPVLAARDISIIRPRPLSTGASSRRTRWSRCYPPSATSDVLGSALRMLGQQFCGINFIVCCAVRVGRQRACKPFPQDEQRPLSWGGD